MAETVHQEPTTPAAEGQQNNERTFTQAEMNAIISDRLSRERSKYADYDDLKAKAQQFDAAQEAGKTELQKANEKAAKLQAQLDSMTKANTLRDIRGKVAAHRRACRTAFRRHRRGLYRTGTGHPQVCTARLPQHPGRRRSPQQTHRLHPPAVC